MGNWLPAKKKTMKIGLAILITIHGIIHLFGYLKAFGISEFNALTHPISKTFGLFWLLTFVLFAITMVLRLYSFDYWWVIGIVAVITSQILILNYWSDAKFGTIANVIILVATIIAYANLQFKNKVGEERRQLYENAQSKEGKTITEETILPLPSAAQKWLIYSGVIGKKPISNVHLEQELQLKMKEDQKEWQVAKADQYFTIQPPAFNWKINMPMNPVINVVGRDKFENGSGEMSIKMFALIPIVNAQNNKKINEASLQRYLAEIVWFPTAALSPYIHWEAISKQSAKATMSFQGTEGSGVFHFDSNGEFVKFTAMRFRDAGDKKPKLWTVNAIKVEERNGIKIPVECEATWKLENQDWTWLKLKITDIEYNVKEMPVANKS